MFVSGSGGTEISLIRILSKFRQLFIALVFLSATIVPLNAKALGMGLDAGLFLGLGTRGTENTTIEPEVWSVGGYLNGGFKLSPWVQVGGYFEYHSVEQRDAPSTVSGLNFSGTGWLLGPSLAIKMGPLTLIGAYSLMGSYEFENTTSTGLKSELSSPEGIHFLLGVEVIPMVTIDLGYSKVLYSENEIGSIAVDISGNRADYESYRIGFSVHL